MPPTSTLEEAQVQLRELIGKLAPGEELVITSDHQPVAKLVAIPPPEPPAPRPAPGLGKGSIISMAPDFDASLTFAPDGD